MEQELNDEIENLRASKKLLKMKVEEQSKALEAKEDEIGNLEKEIKSMFEVGLEYKRNKRFILYTT